MPTELKRIARVLTRGSFFLFIGKSLSTVIMAVGSIIVARLLGPENYGLYTLAMIAPSLLIPLSDLGISSALTRFSARFRSEGENRKVLALIKAGVGFKVISSMLLSLALLLLSGTIATGLLRRPEISFLIRFTSLYLLGQAVLMIIDSVFIGLDKMEKSCLLMNIQAIIKAVASPLLIIVGMGAIGAILGAGFGVFLAAVTGGAILLFHIYPILHRHNQTENINFSEAVKLMISYGAPLYLSTIILTLLMQYRNFILALFASNTEIGNYTTAMNFSILITLISYPIVTALFPAFSKLGVSEEHDAVKRMFNAAVKYTSLLVIPSSLVIAIFSKELVDLLYGLQFQLAPTYLTFYILRFLFAGLGMFVLGSFFNGQGDTKATLRMNLINLCLSVPLALILTSHYGILGLLVSILAAQFLSTAYGLLLANQKYKMTIDPIASIRIAIASLSSTLITYIFITFVAIPDHIFKLVVGGSLFLTSFLGFAPLFGAINKQDIDNLNELTKGIPLIYQIARAILYLENKIVAARTSLI